MKFLFSLLFFAFFSVRIFAGDPSIWSVSSQADVLKGDARSVSIDSSGALTLAPKVSEVFNTEQSFIWSSAVDAAGNVFLGTGGEGKVFRVTPSGAGSLFSDLPELNVTALAVGRSGEIFAATSPDGKVYRIDASGNATAYFDPKVKYIWSLAVMGDGSLAVGTGEGGKIFRVRTANAAPESSIFFDSSDSHIISLAVDGAGNLYAGTDSNGLVLKFSADGRPFALLDSPLREIHEIAIGRDGSAYVLALSESASAAAPAPSPTPASESRTVSVAGPAPAAPEQPQKSRHDVTGAKSAVYRILPDGGVDVLWSSSSVTGFSIFAQKSGGGALLGTSEKGRIYNISNDGRESLVMQTDASQISTMFSRGADIFATTSNQGRLLKIGPEMVAEGTYESAVLDAKSVASWGRIWWQASGSVQIQTRSGNTESPSETWSPWAIAASAPGASGAKVTSPNARYLQWRAVLRSSSVPAALNEVSLAFLPRNIAPEVLSIQFLPTNVGLVANPPVQIDPNIELSGLDPRVFGIPNQPIPPRRVYQRAARSFVWTAEDRNGDKLVFDVQIKEARDSSYKTLRENITESFFTLDGQSLPDGRYTLKVVAKDSPENPSGVYLTGEKISEPFDIDNTQPTVTAGQPQISGNSALIVFTANDRSSYLARAEFSVNGGPWQSVFAEDGISDSSDERYVVVIQFKPGIEHIVTLRVFDASGNAGSARAVVKQ